MTLDGAAPLVQLASIWLLVFSLGARASVHTVSYMLRRPSLLLRALAALYVVAPAFALLIAETTALLAPIRFAIVAMSIAPVAAVLPHQQMKAGAGEDYTIGLLVASAAAAIVATPFLLEFAARMLDAEATITPIRLAQSLLTTIGLPLAAGMVLKAVWGPASAGIERLAQRVGTILFFLASAAMMAIGWRDIVALLGNGSALAFAAVAVVSLIGGHLLGEGREKAALALAAANRHPGVALAIADMSFPAERPAISAAILLYLAITSLITWPYIHWTRVRGSSKAPDTAAPSPTGRGSRSG